MSWGLWKVELPEYTEVEAVSLQQVACKVTIMNCISQYK